MRAVAVSVVVVAALATGAGSSGGATAAPHVATRAAFPGATSPSWSPDGKQIVFAYVQGSQTGPYRIVRRSSRPDGKVRTVLSVRSRLGCCWQMLWGPGSRILVDPSGGLKSVNVHGGKPKRLDFSKTCRESPCSPQGFILSPNREYAGVTTMDSGSVHGPSAIQLVQMRPGHRAVVLRTPFSGDESDSVLAFSPDSKQLVFGSCQGEDPTDPYGCGTYEEMAVRIPDGRPVPLSQSGIPGAALVPSYVQQLQWSPDGRWVAFVEDGDLEVVPTTGATAPRTLATCVSDFSWSPTSKMIAVDCITQSDGSGQISTVRPDGTHLTNLLQGRPLTEVPWQQESGPQWSPDGSRLLLLAYGEVQNVNVWSIRPNGRGLIQLG